MDFKTLFKREQLSGTDSVVHPLLGLRVSQPPLHIIAGRGGPWLTMQSEAGTLVQRVESGDRQVRIPMVIPAEVNVEVCAREMVMIAIDHQLNGNVILEQDSAWYHLQARSSVPVLKLLTNVEGYKAPPEVEVFPLESRAGFPHRMVVGLLEPIGVIVDGYMVGRGLGIALELDRVQVVMIQVPEGPRRSRFDRILD